MSKDWRALFSRVRAALMRRGRTEQDADDLVQEAWIRLDRYRQEQVVDKPEAFLMRVALNLSADAYRAEGARAEEELLDDLVDTRPSVEAQVSARERMTRLSVCLGRLNRRTRVIFLAHRVDGLSYKDIARQEGLSVSAVEKHIAKATLLVTSWMEGW